VEADHYVCALPVERARKLWSREILQLDPALRAMDRLSTGWMNGIKLFLREEVPVSRGIVVYLDSPWLLTSVSQAQIWRKPFAERYGDGAARESFSVIVSDWFSPGLDGRAAADCSPEELVEQIWAQLASHLNNSGRTLLRRDLLHAFEVDPGMHQQGGSLVSGDPLVLPAAGELRHRPDVVTRIPNLFLAGDYLRSEWEVANMEAASFNARRAVNAILDRTGSRESPVPAIGLYRPPEWEALKRLDAEREARGEPNLFDQDTPTLPRLS
jgi:hypothetical protein